MNIKKLVSKKSVVEDDLLDEDVIEEKDEIAAVREAEKAEREAEKSVKEQNADVPDESGTVLRAFSLQRVLSSAAPALRLSTYWSKDLRSLCVTSLSTPWTRRAALSSSRAFSLPKRNTWISSVRSPKPRARSSWTRAL